MEAVKPLVFKATLSNPVGLNNSYRISYNKRSRKRVFIKSKRAHTWEETSLIALRSSGFVPQPEQMYWCSVTVDMYTSRLDIDAPIKATLDLLMKALSVENKVGNRRIYIGVEDKWFGEVILHKNFCSPKAEQRLEVSIELTPIKSKKEFNSLTDKRREQCPKHSTGQAIPVRKTVPRVQATPKPIQPVEKPVRKRTSKPRGTQ